VILYVPFIDNCSIGNRSKVTSVRDSQPAHRLWTRVMDIILDLPVMPKKLGVWWERKIRPDFINRRRTTADLSGVGARAIHTEAVDTLTTKPYVFRNKRPIHILKRAARLAGTIFVSIAALFDTVHPFLRGECANQLRVRHLW
jgi:hypothetical protein